MIPERFLEELNDRVDIEQLISPYVNLRRAGRNLSGLCPFHNEKTPSFVVYPETRSFFCFGCNVGGGAVAFLMNMEHLDFVEAVKQLCALTGMPLPEDNYDDTLHQRRLRILAANRAAAHFFHENLQSADGAQARAYWCGTRKLSPATVQHFGLGYALPGWDSLRDHLRGKGFTLEELHSANLIQRSEKNGSVHYYDSFRGRVMVPIIDLKGNVVAFGGRVLDESRPKYINTSDTPVYRKGRDLFALNFAKGIGRERLILTEGYLDAIALHQFGFPQAVAGLGTALTREQAQLLARYTNEVVLSYDMDEAGQTAALRAMKLLCQTNLKVKILKLQGGKDPDEVLQTYGAEKFQRCLDGAATELEFQLLHARQGMDLAVPAGKNAYLRACVQILARCSVIECELYAARLGEELGVSKEAILTQIASTRKREGQRHQTEQVREVFRRDTRVAQQVDRSRLQHTAAAKAEERLLGLLLNHPELFARLQDEPETLFRTEFNTSLVVFLRARAHQGLEVAPALLSGQASPEQVSELQRMQLLCADLQHPQAEFDACLQKLRTLSEAPAAPRNDQEFQAALDHLRHKTQDTRSFFEKKEPKKL